MDKAYIEEQLSGLFAMQPRRSSRRRLKLYAEPLGKNFYLANPSGRPLPPDVKLKLAKDGIRMGWKAGAARCPREVYLVELGLMVNAHLWQAGRSPHFSLK
jgi:hypothetical protein